MENIISKEDASKAYKEKILKALNLSKSDIVKIINQKINLSISENCNRVYFKRSDFSSLNIPPQFVENLMVEVELMLITAGYQVINSSRLRDADWDFEVSF